MAYFNTCCNCGANLDPGEKCDCQQNKTRLEKFYSERIKVKSDGQLILTFGGVK